MIRNKVIAAGFAGVIAIAAPVVMYFEGKESHGYIDPVGIPTICYGHTGTAKVGQVKTDAQCEALLQQDLQVALAGVNRLVKVDMPPERRAALVSFVYNVGAGQLASSTLLRKLNAGDAAGACAELSRWVYAGGKRLNGLVKRRAVERELCETGL